MSQTGRILLATLAGMALVVPEAVAATAAGELHLVHVACHDGQVRHEVRDPKAPPTGCPEQLLAYLPGDTPSRLRDANASVMASVATVPEKPGWPIEVPTGAQVVTVARLEARGGLATVFAESGRAHARRPDGSVVPGWPREFQALGNMAAAGDIDDDGLDELLFPSGSLFLRDPDGELLDGWPFSLLPNDGFSGQKNRTLARFEATSPLRVFAAGGRGTFSVLDASAQFLPAWPVEIDVNILNDQAVGDVDGNGVADFIALTTHPPMFRLSTAMARPYMVSR
ncbi:MAG: hypothetical protein ACE5GT_06600 [Rhodospirillales bacterium]